MKITGARQASYNPKTNLLKTKVIDEHGKEVQLDFDGVAFAALAGLANITNAVAHHIQKGAQLPMLWVDGLQTGHQSFVHPKLGKQYGSGIVFVVPGMGILSFFLPKDLELALRQNLASPKKPS